MPLVTNYMLQKKLSEVQLESSRGVSGISTSSNNMNTTEQGDALVPVSITEKTIDRVQGEEFIAKDNTRAKLYYPIPGLKWKCVSQTNATGMVTLNKEVTGLFLTDGSKSYLLGVYGETDEFEVLLQVGDNEIRLNNLFVNIKTDCLISNGEETTL